ncbi:ABC transporter substrate-binding protein [Psychrobacillus psychrodurans]|uniref:Helical backbone metal receptor n=1 Tax=Psychrobacillus psychrodurans TaxID=126157 RepID=A0A9X3LAX2_9BACI|nr:helical backbone metal receptor [Psychrobacillus psychrodurans]MCZ8534508.1 helical backbone metal receptor [Psychrobacillus psychrodurans]
MKKNHVFNWLAVLLFSFLLVGCSAEETTTVEKHEEVVDEVKEYTVTDDAGNEVAFEEVPETIVSLQPSNTEILFALGVGDKIVGATEYDTYPAEALEIERVSDSVAFNAERITELNPDVVIAYTIGQEEALQLLEEAGLKVFVIESATSFEDVYGDIKQLATVMGVEEKGQEIITSIQTTIQEVQEKVETAAVLKKVYYEISPSPDIYTTGSKTFQQEILAAASVDNVFSDKEGWISVSEEDVIAKNPEIILTTSNYIEDATGEIKSRAGWDKIPAVQNDSVFLVDGDVISRPGPRIGEAVELVAKTVYPELFK